MYSWCFQHKTIQETKRENSQANHENIGLVKPLYNTPSHQYLNNNLLKGKTAEGKGGLQTIQVFRRIEAADQTQGPHVHIEHDIRHLDSCHKRPAWQRSNVHKHILNRSSLHFHCHVIKISTTTVYQQWTFQLHLIIYSRLQISSSDVSMPFVLNRSEDYPAIHLQLHRQQYLERSHHQIWPAQKVPM